jgi:thiol-disulfide isomerase/thioredoxin
MDKFSKSNILILLFWIFLIFLFLNDFFFKSCSVCNDEFNNTKIYNEKFNNTKIKVYNFNTTWCGHSLNFQPIWDSFNKSLNKSDNILTYDVKCDNNKNEKLAERYYIEGYPTIIIDYGDKFIKYSGPRTVNSLRSVLNLEPIKEQELIQENNIKCGNTIPKTQTFNQADNSDNIDETTETTIYNFNTSWCGYSLRFQHVWDEFTRVNENTNIKIVDVKCDKSENEVICNKYPVEGFPTVLKVTDNNVIQYNGPRTLEGLQEFIK